MKTLLKVLTVVAVVIAILKLLQMFADYYYENYNTKYVRTDV